MPMCGKTFQSLHNERVLSSLLNSFFIVHIMNTDSRLLTPRESSWDVHHDKRTCETTATAEP
jgi:hypothetical protein